MRFERFPIVVALLLTLSLATVPMFGQSLTTGNITGTVLDPSHAVIAGATVESEGVGHRFNRIHHHEFQWWLQLRLVEAGALSDHGEAGGFCGSSANRCKSRSARPRRQRSISQSQRVPRRWKSQGRLRSSILSRATTPPTRKRKWPSCPAPVVTSPISRTQLPGVVVNGTGRLRKLHRQRYAGHVEPVHGQRRERHGSVLQHQQLRRLQPDAGPERNWRSDGHRESVRRPVWSACGRPSHVRHQVGHQHLPRQCGVLVERPVAQCQQLDEQAIAGRCSRDRPVSASQPSSVSPTPISGQLRLVARSSRTRRFSSSTTKGCDSVLPNVDTVTAPTAAFANAAEAQVACSIRQSPRHYNKLMGLWTNAKGYSGAHSEPRTPGDSCSHSP